MSTRGYFIGQIVDELASLAHQVEMRASLGYTDLHRMIEDFVCEVLNAVLEPSALENLNAERMNAPGLDLGDRINRRAFQVTSRASSTKVKETLQTVVRHGLEKDYDEIVILAVGTKQKQYTIDTAITAPLRFDPARDVWDITDLCRRAVGLPIDRLHRLHTLVVAEMRAVRIELERPDDQGQYPTSLTDSMEVKPDVVGTDGVLFFNDDMTEGLLSSLAETRDDLNAWALKLSNLPRFTRELYAYMLSQGEDENCPGTPGLSINLDILKSRARTQDLDRELRILETRGFIYIDRDESPPVGQSPYGSLAFPGALQENFREGMGYFAQKYLAGVRQAIVSLELSVFGPPPKRTNGQR